MSLRRNFLIFVLVAAFLAACGQPTPGPEDTGGTTSSGTDMGPGGGDDDGNNVVLRPHFELTVATFNAGRFFDTTCDSNNCDDSGDFERQLSDAEFSFKVSQIADGIEELDADIVTLQEVETQVCLDALKAALPDYGFAELGEIGGTASLDVAILARGMTHLETREHRNDTTLELSDGRQQRFAREFLEAHFDRDGERVVAFSAHFKAQRNDDPAWRLGEARAARLIAEETQAEFPDAFVYIGGDLNDEPGSAPLDAMTDSGGLVSVTQEQPTSDIWTYAYLDNRIIIDHILYVPADNGEHVPDLTSVVRNASGSFAGSDHAALRTTFRIFTD